MKDEIWAEYRTFKTPFGYKSMEQMKNAEDNGVLITVNCDTIISEDILLNEIATGTINNIVFPITRIE